MVTLSALTVLQRENQLTRHVANALNLGLSPQQVIEVMIHASWYGGVPTAFNAMGIAKEVFDGLGIEFKLSWCSTLRRPPKTCSTGEPPAARS